MSFQKDASLRKVEARLPTQATAASQGLPPRVEGGVPQEQTLPRVSRGPWTPCCAHSPKAFPHSIARNFQMKKVKLVNEPSRPCWLRLQSPSQELTPTPAVWATKMDMHPQAQHSTPRHQDHSHIWLLCPVAPHTHTMWRPLSQHPEALACHGPALPWAICSH